MIHFCFLGILNYVMTDEIPPNLLFFGVRDSAWIIENLTNYWHKQSKLFSLKSATILKKWNRTERKRGYAEKEAQRGENRHKEA